MVAVNVVDLVLLLEVVGLLVVELEVLVEPIGLGGGV